MEPLWSPVVATSGKRWQMPGPRKPQKQAKSVAIGCRRLRSTFHGKQGVCRGLRPVAGGPLPVKEGVDVKVIRCGALSVAAIRAWTLVAAAAGACLADHAPHFSAC